MTKYNEDYLNGLIAKAKKSWEGVDVESFMSDLRDVEKEQKVLENLKREIKKDNEAKNRSKDNQVNLPE